ncbi:MAG: GatB/YqeY domain-containing protein [Patescibacteria group bacterium]
MDLKDQIEQDFVAAYKQRDDEKVSVLRMIKSSLKNLEINEKRPVTDEDAQKILKKEIKQRQDSIAQYQNGGRNDLAYKEEKEAKIISGYLPKQLGEAEIRAKLCDIIKKNNFQETKDLGKIIGLAVRELGGAADGSLIAKIAKEELS